MTWKSGRIIVSKEPLCEVLQLELPEGVLPTEVMRYPNGSLQEIRSTFAMQMTLYGDETRGKLVEYRQHFRAGPVWILRPNIHPEDLCLQTNSGKGYLRELGQGVTALGRTLDRRHEARRPAANDLAIRTSWRLASCSGWRGVDRGLRPLVELSRL